MPQLDDLRSREMIKDSPMPGIKPQTLSSSSPLHSPNSHQTRFPHTSMGILHQLEIPISTMVHSRTIVMQKLLLG